MNSDNWCDVAKKGGAIKPEVIIASSRNRKQLLLLFMMIELLSMVSIYR